jgi:hypothetical protein
MVTFSFNLTQLNGVDYLFARDHIGNNDHLRAYFYPIARL